MDVADSIYEDDFIFIFEGLMIPSTSSGEQSEILRIYILIINILRLRLQ